MGIQKTVGILLGAGSSSRMGENKLLMPLGNTNALKLSFDAFCNSELDEIIIAVSDSTHFFANTLCEGSKTPAKCVMGGEMRAHSVINALNACENAEIVVIHDAARCLITPETINQSIQQAQEYGSAIASNKVVDTLRYKSNHQTLDRDELLAMQTPQAFRFDLIKNAYKQAEKLENYTDDCEIFLQAGHIPHYFINDFPNMKLTFLGDIEIFLAILQSRGGQSCE